MAIDWWWKLMKSVFRRYKIKERINRVGKAKSFEGNPKLTKIIVVFCVPFLCIFFSFQNKIHWNNYQNKQRSKRRTLKHQQIRKILKQQKSDKKKKFPPVTDVTKLQTYERWWRHLPSYLLISRLISSWAAYNREVSDRLPRESTRGLLLSRNQDLRFGRRPSGENRF